MYYENKLALAKEALESGSYDKETIEYIFPELKEDSEDERIRKQIIQFIKKRNRSGCDYDYDKWIIWLEKQGKQNLSNKLESKFKQGEWIVWKDKCYKVNYNGCGYELFDQNGLSTSWDYKTIEDNAHLWTIKDAKDGDVLAVEPIDRYQFPFIAIYKNRGLDFFNSYCYIGFDGKFYEADTGHILDNIHPATKEQRDLLFQKLKEAGYEWDVEKKELKNIEDEPLVIDEGKAEMDYCFTKMMNNEKISPTWSVKDEEMWIDAIKYLELFDAQGIHGNVAIPCIKWIKSLKDRYTWKPSEEQIEVLNMVVTDEAMDTNVKTILKELIIQLKKL